MDNPARKKANAAVHEAEKTLAAAERELAGLLADPGITPAAKNARIPALQRKITRARTAAAAAAAARNGIPAKLPASTIDADAKTALLRAGRRGLQMVLRLLAHNAEHWLATHLNAYLHDNDEYRAITRETIIRGPSPAPSPAPPPRSPSPSSGPAHPASPAPWPCSSTKSTQPRPPFPATPAPSPTSWLTTRHLTPSAQPPPEIWARRQRRRSAWRPARRTPGHAVRGARRRSTPDGTQTGTRRSRLLRSRSSSSRPPR